jgi:hypothetical protein
VYEISTVQHSLLCLLCERGSSTVFVSFCSCSAFNVELDLFVDGAFLCLLIILSISEINLLNLLKKLK